MDGVRVEDVVLLAPHAPIFKATMTPEMPTAIQISEK